MTTDEAFPIELCCLDMAGTTVTDDGAVTDAFCEALNDCGVGEEDPRRVPMLEYVRETMGTSKIVVFRHLFNDDALAETANAHFEAHYDAQLEAGKVAPMPGAEAAIASLRSAGIRVVLTTGFSARTRDRLLEVLGWRYLVDATLCPSEAGRGRPFPDLVLKAALISGVSDVRAIAVAGDTPADIKTGRSAGASRCVGVLSGLAGRAELEAAGATDVTTSVADLPELLSLGSDPSTNRSTIL